MDEHQGDMSPSWRRMGGGRHEAETVQFNYPKVSNLGRWCFIIYLLLLCCIEQGRVDGHSYWSVLYPPTLSSKAFIVV